MPNPFFSLGTLGSLARPTRASLDTSRISEIDRLIGQGRAHESPPRPRKTSTPTSTTPAAPEHPPELRDPLAEIRAILGLDEPSQADRSEPAFQQWYARAAQTHDLNPDPDAPDQFYDYRAAFKAGATPDASGHWPSQFKKPGHPNEVVGGFNTRTGERVPGTPQASESELVARGWAPADAARMSRPAPSGPPIPSLLPSHMAPGQEPVPGFEGIGRTGDPAPARRDPLATGPSRIFQNPIDHPPPPAAAAPATRPAQSQRLGSAKTGGFATEPPKGQGVLDPIGRVLVDLPIEGVQQAASAVTRLGTAAATAPPNVPVMRRSRTGRLYQSAMAPPVSGETMNAASDLMEGAFKAGTPLFVPAMIANPLISAAVLGAGIGAQKGAEAGTTALGATPEEARFTGNLAAIIAGSLAGEGAARVRDAAGGSAERVVSAAEQAQARAAAAHVLGVDPHADVDTLRTAYRAAARENHPDLNPNADPTRMADINLAYEWLIDHPSDSPRAPHQSVADWAKSQIDWLKSKFQKDDGVRPPATEPNNTSGRSLGGEVAPDEMQPPSVTQEPPATVTPVAARQGVGPGAPVDQGPAPSPDVSPAAAAPHPVLDLIDQTLGLTPVPEMGPAAYAGPDRRSTERVNTPEQDQKYQRMREKIATGEPTGTEESRADFAERQRVDDARAQAGVDEVSALAFAPEQRVDYKGQPATVVSVEGDRRIKIQVDGEDVQRFVQPSIIKPLAAQPHPVLDEIDKTLGIAPASEPAPPAESQPIVARSENRFAPKSDRLTKDPVVLKEWKRIHAGLTRTERAIASVQLDLSQGDQPDPKEVDTVKKAVSIYDDFAQFFDRYDMPQIDQWSRWQRAQDDAKHTLSRLERTGHLAEPGHAKETDHAVQEQGANESGVQRGAGAGDEGQGAGVGEGNAQPEEAAGARQAKEEVATPPQIKTGTPGWTATVPADARGVKNFGFGRMGTPGGKPKVGQISSVPTERGWVGSTVAPDGTKLYTAQAYEHHEEAAAAAADLIWREAWPVQGSYRQLDATKDAEDWQKSLTETIANGTPAHDLSDEDLAKRAEKAVGPWRMAAREEIQRRQAARDDLKGKGPAWTKASAGAFLEVHKRALAKAGFLPEIVGGVGTKGQSSNDLDIVLRPIRPFKSMDAAEDSFIDHVAESLGEDPVMLNFAPNTAHEPGEMLRVFVDETGKIPSDRTGTRVVEFYLPNTLYAKGKGPASKPAVSQPTAKPDGTLALPQLFPDISDLTDRQREALDTVKEHLGDMRRWRETYREQSNLALSSLRDAMQVLTPALSGPAQQAWLEAISRIEEEFDDRIRVERPEIAAFADAYKAAPEEARRVALDRTGVRDPDGVFEDERLAPGSLLGWLESAKPENIAAATKLLTASREPEKKPSIPVTPKQPIAREWKVGDRAKSYEGTGEIVQIKGPDDLGMSTVRLMLDATKTYSKWTNVTSLAPLAAPAEITVTPHALTGDAAKVQAKAIAALEKDPQDFKDRYVKDFGRVLNADNASELFEDYAKSEEARAMLAVAVRAPAGALVDALFKDMLAAPTPEGQEPVAVFTAGGNASGKSSGVSDEKTADIIFDSTFSSLAPSQANVERALAAGRAVRIRYVYRDPMAAFASALDRAMGEANGRTVTVRGLAATTIGARETVLALAKAYADDPRVSFAIRESTDAKPVPRDLAWLKEQAYDDRRGLETRLFDALEAAHDAGDISDAVYEGTRGLGRRPEEDRQGDGRRLREKRGEESPDSSHEEGGAPSQAVGESHGAPAGRRRDDTGQLPERGGNGPHPDRAGSESALGTVLPEPGEGTERPEPDRTGDGGARGVVADGVPDEGRPTQESGPALVTSAGSTPDRALAPAGIQHDAGHAAPDYQLTPERIAAIIGRGTVARAKGNLAAIKIVKALRAEARYATPDEQDALAKYVGWGASDMAAFLSDEPSHTWSANEKSIWKDIQDSTTEEERAALVRSTPNAHFTFDLYKPIWEALERYGFTGGRILEPAVGAGHAFGFMPSEIRGRSTLNATELDPLTAAIAQALYPSARVQPLGYEQARIPSNTQDLIISNVPFGAYGVSDRRFANKPFLTERIHNYFFAKALEHARPGGVVLFVTSRYTMDEHDSKVRKYLMTQAHFIGAVRLPNIAFKGSAKTEVITDVIVLQKFLPGETVARNADLFTKSEELDLGGRSYDNNGRPQPIYRSTWYTEHPELVLGKEDRAGSMYGDNQYNVTAKNKDVLTPLREALETLLPANAYQPATTEAATPAPVMAEGAFKSGELRVGPKGDKDVRIQRVDRDGALVDATPRKVVDKATGKTAVDEAQVGRIAGMIGVRDRLRAVLATMGDPDASDAAIRKAQTALRKAYDTFVENYGHLSSGRNKAAFQQDPEVANLAGLEIQTPKGTLEVNRKGEKILKIRHEVTGLADIFTKRTIQAPKAIDHVETPKDALLASLGVKTQIDWPYIEQITGQDRQTIQAALKADGHVFEQPDGTWTTADAYLSGDVVSKLEDAAAAADDDPERFAANVEALKAVQPAPKTKEHLESGDVSITLGSHWVPPQDIVAFVRSELPRTGKHPVKIRLDGAETYVHWSLDFAHDTESHGNNHALAVPYGPQRGDGTKSYVYGFTDLLRDALNLQQPDLGWWEGRGDDRVYHKDPDGTKAARANLEELRSKWMQWVFENEPVQTRLLDLYNSRFNRTVKRTFDGAHLANYVDPTTGAPLGPKDGGVRSAALPGLALPFLLHPHQLDFIWRSLTTGNALAGHEVGAGKTFALIGLAMEMRRTGRARKPMVTVPTHLLGQWRQDILTAYPGAKILAFDEKDLAADKRQQAMARIAFGDWDIVLVPHSSFGLLKVSEQRMVDLLQQWVDELMDAEQEARSKSGNARKDLSVKKLAAVRAKLQRKIDDKLAVLKERSNDNALTWEQLGVDALLVDEAHSFKNLYFHSKMDALRGLSRSEADKSLDLFVKVRDINEASGHRNLVFATATPVMNSVAEIYTMQRYLQPQRLREAGLENFDNWYQMFARAEPSTEQRPDGTYHEVMRLKSYNNLQLLYRMFSEVMDYVGWEDMPYLKLPGLKGGRIKIFETQPHPLYPQIRQWFTDRLEAIRQVPPHVDDEGAYHAPERMHPITGEPMGRPDNILTIMNDAKKAAIDMRLVLGSYAKDFAGSRVQTGAREFMKVYKAEEAKKGAQLIFIDVGTPKGSEPLEFLSGVKVEDETAGASLGVEDEEPIDEESVVGADDDGGDNINLYDAIKRALIGHGVPSREIAFIHQARNAAERLALFQAVNDGTVRFLLASTDKGGVGMNVQERLAAVWHIDAPRMGRPGDLRQRDGRGLRQGNTYKDITIGRFITKGTTDEWLYGLLNAKSDLINSFMRGNAMSFTDDDPSTMSLEEAQIRATGDPRGIELTELRAALPRLQAQAAAADRGLAQAKANLSRAEQSKGYIEKDLKALRKWLPNFKTLRGDAFEMTVGPETFAKRDAAETALVAAAATIPAGGAMQRVGAVNGLPILMRRLEGSWSKMKDREGEVYDHRSPDMFSIYTDETALGQVERSVWNLNLAEKEVPKFEGVNVVARIVNDYEDIRKREATYTARVADLDADIADAKATIEKPSPARDKAVAAQARITEIETELRAEGKVKDAETKDALTAKKPEEGQAEERPRYRIVERAWTKAPKAAPGLKTSSVNPDVLELALPHGETQRVVGKKINAYFAVHKAGKLFRLVHLPSSRMLAEYDSREAAIAVAERLTDLGGTIWSETDPTVLMKSLPADLKAEAQRLVNPQEADALARSNKSTARGSGGGGGNAMAAGASSGLFGGPPKPPRPRTPAGGASAPLPNAPLPDAAGLTQRAPSINLRGIVPALRAILHPEGLGPAAVGAAGTIRHEGAKSFRELTIAREALKDFGHAVDELSREDAVRYWDAAEHGRSTGDPEMDAGNALLREITDRYTRELVALDRLKAESTIANYIGRFWSVEPTKLTDFVRRALGRRPLEGPKSFLKQRSWESFTEGIRAIQGAQARVAAGTPREGDDRLAAIQPATYNWVESQLAKIAEMQRVIAAEKMLRYEAAVGRAKKVLDSMGHKPPTDADGEPWVNLSDGKDPAFIVYGPKTVTIREAYDAKLMEGLHNFARSLGVQHVRKVAVGGNRWGYAVGASHITTKVGGPEGVLMHEIGHILDEKYGLRQQWVNNKTMRKELRDLADLREEGTAEIPASRKRYLRKGEEKIANLVHAFIYMPERTKRVAPNAYWALHNLAKDTPELRPLLDLQKRGRSLKLDVNTVEQEIPGFPIVGHWYAPKAAAAVWTNHLSRGLRGNPLYDAYMTGANASAQILLGFSGFHFTTIAREGLNSRLAQSLDALANRGRHVALGEAARHMIAAPGAAAVDAAFGRRIMEEYRAPGAHPEVARVLDGMIAGGYRGTAESEFWTGDRIEKLRESFNDAIHAEAKGRQLWGAAKLPLNALWAGVELTMKPLMGKYVPWMKTAATYRAVAQALEKLDPDTSMERIHTIMGDIVKEMDYRYGQVVYDNHFVNRIVKDLAHAAFLAPGWTFGTLALATRGVAQIAQIPVKGVKRLVGAGGGDEPLPDELVGSSAAYWIGGVLAFMLINGILTYLHTGQQPSGKDYFGYRDGTKDDDGNPNRHILPGYEMRDIYGWSNHPVQTFLNKLKPAIAFMARLAENRTYFGDMVYDPESTLPQKAVDIGKQAVKDLATPLSVQNYTESLRRRDTGPAEIARNVFGITPAKREFERTPAQNLMEEYLNRRGHTARTPEQSAKADVRREVREALRRGDTAAASAASGDLTKRQMQAARTAAKTPGMNARFKQLTITEAMNVYEQAEPAERAVFWPVFRAKMHLIQEAAPHDRADLGRRYRRVLMLPRRAEAR